MIGGPPIGAYQIYRITGALATATPVGQPVNTTSSTYVYGGQVNTITPVNMANIALGMVLVIYGGAGTAEEVQVLSVSTTAFTALFANSHSGPYHVTSKRKIQVGAVAFNQLGTGMTLTLYNGNPDSSLAAQFANAPGYGTLAVITPSSTPTPIGALAAYGLYVKYTGTTPGDVSLQYLGRTL